MDKAAFRPDPEDQEDPPAPGKAILRWVLIMFAF